MIHTEQINNKLLILFILDKIERPLDEEVLLQICSIDNQWIPYFYCKQVILELLDSGFIKKVISSTTNPLLSLTTDGSTCLAHFYNDIAKSVRDNVQDFIRAEQINYRKRQEFISDYYRNADGTFTLALKILEVTKPLVDIKLVVPTRQAAVAVHNTWQEKATEVYQSLMDILIEN